MFITLKHINDRIKIRINVLSIVAYYEYHGNGIGIPEVCTKVKTNDADYCYVVETPEQIDVLIEEAKESEITNIDNLMGFTFYHYGYGRG